MCPQKWYALASCAFNAAATAPPPLVARRSRPARAKKPRREVAARIRSGSKDRLELRQRVERPLRADGGVGAEHDGVRAAGNTQCAPDVRIRVLVEPLQLDVGVGGDDMECRFDRAADGTA